MLLRPLSYTFDIDGEKYECNIQTLQWYPGSKIPEYKLKVDIYKKHGHALYPVEIKREKRMTWKEFVARLIEIIRTGI